jgi:hypothetical protein
VYGNHDSIANTTSNKEHKMTSSSSLYGSVNQQNTQSTNSTSLYGGADTPIPTPEGDLVVRGDLIVLSGNILTTATTGNIFPANATTVNLGGAATAINIGANTGTTTINNNLVVDGDITANGGDFGNITVGITDNNTIASTTGGLKLTPTDGNVGLIGTTTLYTDNIGTFNLLNSPTTIYAFDEATTLEIGASSGVGTTVVRNSFAVDGTQIGLAQGTIIAYSEANDRLNRPVVRSTTGNTSGFRVEAPNATTSASAVLSAFNTNDTDNGSFININARGNLTTPLRIQTGKYTSGVLGPSGTSLTFVDNITAYASLNPSGPTNPLDLTTKAYVDALPANITYTIDSSATTGGANLNLVGSDATTDSVKFAGGTNVTVSRTDANTITISAPDTNTTYTQNASATTGGANLNLVGSDATTDTIKFAQGTGISVSRTDANTITITNTAPDVNTTYTQNFSSTTGGTNLNLVGSDATTDTVKFADGTGVTVSYTDANTATVAIGQAVGTSDNVQFNGVTTNSITTGTVNANGGVSFVNTAPMGGTYATINPFGPFNTDDLTTVGYVNSVLPTVVTYTQDASATTGGANLNLVGSDATTDTVKFSGSGATTVSQTSANEITISSTDTNTTYTIDASSTTGGANLNLVGSDSTTDTVKIASGTGVTVARTSANELSVAIGQSVATTADVTFNTVNANITDDNYVLGQLYATRNTAYVPPASPLTTIAGQNGIVVVSGNGGLGYAPNITIRQHVGDTTAGANVAGGISMSNASGTNTAPTGIATNAIAGTFNYDGYTAGTSNNYANIIATTNQGGGTTSITPLQAQAYARQAFTNSTTVTTAVTGASGTGTTATLTFTTQNTAPYAVGQTVTVAGMTPSGYNGTYVITAATTSSISYANATTGFTTGGTIGAANTVTAAGMGFRIRGFANSTPLTTANRFNFMDLTASAATFKSDAYTFANSVITGSTLTATNYMTLGATTGSINQDTFTLKNTAGTTTYATLNSTSATLNGDTVALRNSAGTTTYGNFTSTGTTITGAGLHTLSRTTVGTPGTTESRPTFNIQLVRSDQATPNNGDGTSFRTRVAGSNGTFYTISDLNSTYVTSGDVSWNLNLANGDQTGATFSSLPIISASISQTTIKAGTPSATPGASTASDVVKFDPNKITAFVPIKFPTYTKAQANAITGAVGWQISISDSASGGNPNGMMAFWDTSNARWSYIHDNSAV